MPALAHRFEANIGEAVDIPAAGETVRSYGRHSSTVRKYLTASRLEALYELALLRIFLYWEEFLEEALIRYMCDYQTAGGHREIPVMKYKTLDDARTSLLGSRPYILWNPDAAVDHVKAHLTGAVANPGSFAPVYRSNFEQVLRSDKPRLKSFVAVRNQIAHRSRHSEAGYRGATMLLAGRHYPPNKPGRFLRDYSVRYPSPHRWLDTVRWELVGLAHQIVPP
jgi:hypothetical protein